jgi:polar amino acid transport system permease protein
MTPDSKPRTILAEVFWNVVLLVVIISLVWIVFNALNYNWHWESMWKWRWLILRGWAMTIGVSAVALLVSVPLGLLLMLGQRSHWIPVRLACRGCVELVRGTPLLVLLLIGYYGVANALGVGKPWLPGVFLLALFHSAYLSEIFRGAWESIGASQLEAASAVGFNQQQTWRFVIFPQAFRRALPGTAGQMVSLIKDSSLLSVIGVEELTQMVRAANAQAYTALEGYIPLAVLYLLLTIPLSWWTRQIEERFKFET